ncbi:DUF1129 domain-containing protein [Streptococcus cuniculipharyngis]|uniref:DUF1129 domain-containing protein n=1 Tax=Streptococcus cuniculipharyngis TaxID=1562651 RepID=A0A5C5S8R2_9STRE|nr:DUF1129 family protein [Streptococcus cuniculipharyngis]TWS96269.1 DUF1129 domain-containing protein [Streptococcus cuniculipharyngis]
MSIQNLTKKNQEFINIATHQLIKDGKSDTEIKAILEEALPSILEQQQKGVPARSFLGAPTLWAASFSQKVEEKQEAAQPKNTKPLLMWLDSSFFLLAIVALINGFMGLVNPKSVTSISSGLTTLLVLAFVGGVAFYVMYYYIYRHANKPRSERPNTWKSLGIVFLATLIWMFAYMLTPLLPQALNPSLPSWGLLMLSLLSFGVCFVLRRRYNVQSAFAPQR